MFTTTERNSCRQNTGAHHQGQAKFCTLERSTSHPTCSSPSWQKEKSWSALRGYPTAQCKPNCLHVSSFSPANEALAGYLIAFNIVGELPTEEQQTPPWTLMPPPSHRQLDHPPCSMNISAPCLQQEGCNYSSVGSMFPAGSSKTPLTTLTERGEDVYLPRNGPR